MTIKAIKEAYANYKADCGKTMYKVYDFGGEYGKGVIICKNAGHDLKTVDQVVRVADGKELLADHRWRWCDNLEDAVSVASEMLADNDEYVEEPDLNEALDNDMIIETAEAFKAPEPEYNEYTFRTIEGDFYEGNIVTVELLEDGKRYTRKVKYSARKWGDLYITINGKEYPYSEEAPEQVQEKEKDLRTLLAMEYKEMTPDERLRAVKDRFDNYTFHKAWLENHRQYDGRNLEYRFHKEAMTKAYDRLRDWFAEDGLELLPMPANF